MSIIRVQKNENYSIISNGHINDDRLSWKATAILTYLLSKPNDWTVYVKQLAKAKKDGIKAVYSGIKELKEFGYIEHKFIHGEDGKIQHGEYIVHEEPIDVETLFNREPEPYTQKGDTVKGNAENGTLLSTNSKINTDDDKQAPPNPAPVISSKINQVIPSSSFSKSKLVPLLATLLTLVPEQHQQQSVKKILQKGLSAHTEEYIRLAILYTAAHSNGDTTQKFKAYLGKCIDLGWADGWEPEKQSDQTAIKNEFRKMTDDVLTMLAGAGNQFATDELARRKK